MHESLMVAKYDNISFLLLKDTTLETHPCSLILLQKCIEWSAFGEPLPRRAVLDGER